MAVRLFSFFLFSSPVSPWAEGGLREAFLEDENEGHHSHGDIPSYPDGGPARCDRRAYVIGALNVADVGAAARHRRRVTSPRYPGRHGSPTDQTWTLTLKGWGEKSSTVSETRHSSRGPSRPRRVRRWAHVVSLPLDRRV